MSQYLDNMAIGDAIDFRGPNGLLVYKGNGTRCGSVERKNCKRCSAVTVRHQQMSLWYNIILNSGLLRSVFHPSGQEVGAQGSEV